MDNINLNSGESIVLSNQNVVVEGARHQVILTTDRLLFIRKDTPDAPPKEVSLKTLQSASAGENALREPTITFAISEPDGAIRSVQLVFIRHVSEQKNPQFNEWINQLKTFTTVSMKEQPEPCAKPDGHSAHEKVSPKDLPVSGNQECQPQDMTKVPTYVFRPPKAAALKDETNLMSKAVILIIVITLVVIGALAISQMMKGGSPQDLKSSGVAGATERATSAPTLKTTTVATTPAPAAMGVKGVAAPQNPVPTKGVWVRVEYSGHYNGSVGTAGRMRDINSTGTQIFQIPAKDAIIDAEIRKLDGSGGLIALELYNDGTRIKRVNSTNPFVSISLHEKV